jgi:hypothetical protein
MTVSNQTNRVSAVGSGAVGQVVPFEFPITNNSDITVTQRVTADGIETTLAETTNYTVTNNGTSGGSITTVTSVATTAEIHIVRNTPDTQSTDLEQGGNFSAPVVENSLDKLTKLVIEKEDAINRMAKPPVTDPTSSLGDIPSSIDRASKQYGWDSAGKPTAIEAVPTGSVSFSTIGTNIAEAADADAVVDLLDSTTSTFSTGDITTRFPYIDVRSYGVTGDGSTDDITALQAATDAAETKGIPLLFPPSATNYVIAGTWYIGNITVYGYGATLELKNDASWSRLGTASNNGVGGIITKSAAAAGYGLSTVEFHIEALTIYNNRTASGGTSVNGQLLMEQVSRGSLDHVRIYADQNNNSNLLDFYSNVKNFHVSNCEFSNDNTAKPGGVWVRNFDTVNPTEFINFNNCKFYTTGADEILSIFQSSSVVTTVQNVNVNNCSFFADTGATLAHIVSVHADNASGVVRNINISNFTIESAVNITTALFENTATGTNEHVNVTNGSIRMQADTTSADRFAIRGVDSVSNVNIHVAALTDFTNEYIALQSCGQVTGTKVTFDSGINLTTNVFGARACGELTGNDIQGRISACEIVSGNTLSDGQIDDNVIVTNNDITISNNIGATGVIRNNTDNGGNTVIGNIITETYGSEVSTDRVFFFDSFGPTICNDNWYTGKRELFLTSAYDITSFKNNRIDTTGGTTILGYPDGGSDMSDDVTTQAAIETLQSSKIFADHLGSKGGIRVHAAGTKSGGSGDSTVQLEWGSTIMIFNAEATDTNDWSVEAIIVNTATGAQRITWRGWNGTTASSGYEAGTEDTTSDVTVRIRATTDGFAGGDRITQTMWLIEDLY